MVDEATVRKEVSRWVDDVIRRANAPERLQGVPDLFQKRLFRLPSDVGVFSGELYMFLLTNYHEGDRDQVYAELLDYATEYGRLTD